MKNRASILIKERIVKLNFRECYLNLQNDIKLAKIFENCYKVNVNGTVRLLLLAEFVQCQLRHIM